MSEHVETCPTPAGLSPAQIPDCDAKQLAHGRYLDALHDLVEDASAGEHMQVLADALAWTVARLAVAYGLAATGDLLSLVGKYMTGIEARNAAERELERERAVGRLPN